MSTDKPADDELPVNSEHVMLVVMLAIATYMLVESYRFSYSAAFFPRFTASITIVGVVLLLVRNYLPSPLYEYVAESTDVLNGYQDVGSTEDDDSSTDAGTRADDRPISAPTFTVVALAAYVLGGYFVGLLWVTPLFVLGYTSWFKLGWVARIGLTVAGFGIAFGFAYIMNFDLHEPLLSGFPPTLLVDGFVALGGL